MKIRAIDVSAYNNAIDFEDVASAGIEAAILRITERGNKVDPTFERNYEGFRKNGVKAGVYKYSYALNVDQAREEADKVLVTLDGRKLDFPVFYDMEWAKQRNLPGDTLTRIIRQFRRKIIDGGYLFGIYCNTDWYYHVLDTASLPYDYWLAAYPYNDRGVVVESLRPPVGVGWQYSSRGTVPGISGYVDLNEFYKDYSGTKPEADEEYAIYRVKRGDTLTAIALKYGTTAARLAEINNIANVDLILEGQKLRVPCVG